MRMWGGLAPFLVGILLVVAPALAPPAAGGQDSTAEASRDLTGSALVVTEVTGSDYVRSELLVGIRPGTGPEHVLAVRGRVGASLVQSFPGLGIEHWRLPEGTAVGATIRALAGHPDLRYAEPNYIWHAELLPMDPFRNDLYGMHNIGQTGGTLDADIDALEAWDVETGTGTVVVGVIDTGIDYNHQDLLGNIWTNPGEDLDGNGAVDATDFNGLDDDGNGFVDDLRGWDCINNDNNPIDDNNHGTHVSGTIGGKGNNGVGVVGVNWNVKLMPLKFLGAGGSGSNADAIECVNYAASFVDASGNKVVRVTSNSWGGGSRSNALRDAIAASGALFVAAAGNSGSSQKMYPAGYDLNNILAVAATDHNDALAGFSNFGSWVDEAAPGVSVLSTTRNNGYARFSGTSMATPHVSGAAALVMSEFPAMTILEVKAQLMNTVDVLPSLQGKVVSNGRLNVARAVGGTPDPADPAAPDAVTDLAADPTGTTTSAVKLNWTAVGDDGIVGTAYLYDLRYLASTPVTDANWDAAIRAKGEPLPEPTGTLQTVTINGLEPSTTYHFAMKVVDEAGNPSPLSNDAAVTTTTPPPGAWIATTVDSAGNVGTWTSIDMDALGNPHISYRDDSNADLRYARRVGGTWTLETVPDPEGNVGCYSSVALDAMDRARIAYGGGCGLVSWLKFAQWTGSAWLTETVDQTAQGVGWDVSLALGPSDAPHIAHYKQWGQNALRYARWTGSGWDRTSVEQGSGVGRATSIAVDASGFAHISYTVPNEVHYAHWTGAAWQIEVVATGGGQTAIALDATGTPYVAFTGAGGYLMISRRTMAGWGSFWVVDANGRPGHGSLEIDGFGNPRIAYYDTQNRDLKYARWDGTAWIIQVVDSDGDVGAYASLAFDGAGNPHISYYDATEANLKYARIQT